MNASLKITVVAFVLLIAIIATPVVYTMVTGDFPGASKFYGLQEDDSLVMFIFDVRSMFLGR